MKLIFDIIKNGSDFPKKRNYHFNRTSGTIGRSEQSDWHLVDSQSIISNIHAKIEFRDNMYFIADTSTNGTYLKYPYKRLPKNIPIKINSTDIFIMGDYEIQARFLDKDYSNNDLVSYSKQINTSNNDEPIRVSDQLIPNDDFFLDDSEVMDNSFLEEENSYTDTNVMNLFPSEDDQIDDLYDFEKEPFLFEQGHELDSVTHNAEHEHIRLPEVNSTQNKSNFIQQTHAVQQSQKLEADYVPDVNLFEAMEKKLGIQLNDLPKDQRDEKLIEISQIVLNTLDGLQYTLETNSRIKKDLMIETNEALNQNNPVKQGQFAINILNQRGDSDSIKISEAVKKSFNEINIHDIALHRTSKNLINIALNKFSPKSLEHHFESNNKINNLMPKKAQMWEAYTEMFNKMQNDSDFGVNMIAKEFSNEYNNISYTIKLTSI